MPEQGNKSSGWRISFKQTHLKTTKNKSHEKDLIIYHFIRRNYII